MAQQKTLYSFFKKLPSAEKPAVVPESIKSPKAPSAPSPKSSSVKKKAPITSMCLQISSKPLSLFKLSDDFSIYEIVWAKLDGYPWWPALVCQDPDVEKHITKTQIHVQFFDRPPSRSWVSRNTATLPYNQANDGDKRSPKKCSESDREKLKIACKEADDALKLEIDQRDSLLVDFGESSDNNVSTGKL